MRSLRLDFASCKVYTYCSLTVRASFHQVLFVIVDFTANFILCAEAAAAHDVRFHLCSVLTFRREEIVDVYAPSHVV